MDSLYTALSIACFAGRRVAVITSDIAGVVSALESLFRVNGVDSTNLDVQKHLNSTPPEGLSSSSSITFWTNVDLCSPNQQRHLVKALLEIDHYDTNESREARARQRRTQPLQTQTRQAFEPTIVLVISDPDRIIQSLKLKFWFAQVCWKFDTWDPPQDWLKQLSLAKAEYSKVFMASEVQRYIYSLIVHSRNHRLCLVSPMLSRLPTLAIESIADLAKAIVVWTAERDTRSDTAPRRLFVTPDVCKIAMRKIGYWLINWRAQEMKRLPRELKVQHEQRNSTRYDMLLGDWYGSEWDVVQRYISLSKEKERDEWNVIVEDTIANVQPPM